MTLWINKIRILRPDVVILKMDVSTFRPTPNSLYKLFNSRVNLDELHTEGKQGPASADGHFLYLGGSDAEGTVFIIFY